MNEELQQNNPLSGKQSNEKPATSAENSENQQNESHDENREVNKQNTNSMENTTKPHEDKENTEKFIKNITHSVVNQKDDKNIQSDEEQQDKNQNNSDSETKLNDKKDDKNSKEIKPEDKSNMSEGKTEESGNKDTGNKSESEADSMPDYTSMSKEELLNCLKHLIAEESISDIKVKVDTIKNSFYKIRKAEIADLKRLHIENGKDAIEFEPPVDQDEKYLKELLEDYKNKKAEYQKQQEKIKQENLEKKKEIIEKIKVLANGEESLNKTFQEFRELQKEWQNIGNVPKDEAKELWSNYNLQIERFYDFIKINRELRDLDLKKNMEIKINLCEKAEALLLESDIVKAWETLQKYHDDWRETGPVPKEHREELWERFSKATREINKKHQEHFLKKKEERKANLQAKEALCEKAEILAEKNPKTIKEWNEKTNEIQEIQKVWKTIGMVPKKDNAPIYERFRAACNVFFDKKHEYFKEIFKQQEENLQKKTDLCVQAEALQDSTDWNKTKQALIDLQKQWKKIGPVPKKDNERIWKRFRAACNNFFDARDRHFKEKSENEKVNAEEKRKIIEEVKNYKLTGDKSKDLKNIQNFQSRWTNIGFVPIEEKNKLQNEYREAIDKLFNDMNMSSKNLGMIQYQTRVDMWVQENDMEKIKKELKFIKQKINKIKDDIVLLENNMSFFSDSSSDSVIKDVKSKIEKNKEEQKKLSEKKKILDIALRKFNSDNEK